MDAIKKFIGIFLVLLIASSCDDNEFTPQFTKDKLVGFVQKGPFLNGTALSIIDLDGDLHQSGRTYTSQIIDNSGTFELSHLELSSEYILLRANGFYFNEITGQLSTSQLTLNAISRIDDKNKIYINVLSNLEYERVRYLVDGGMSFDLAKTQALQEILNIFSLVKTDIKPSELLDISQSEEDNAILLAISIILQGSRTEGELAELLANIGTDIRTDGTLNSSILGSELINGIMYVNLAEVRNNLEDKYATIGIEAIIPNFEKYVYQFIDSTSFEFTNYIVYPTNGKWGKNILNNTDSIFSVGSYYSMAAILPSGTTITVKHNGNDGSLAHVAFQENTGWDDLGPDETMMWRTLRTNRTGEVDIKMFFTDNATLYIYENNSDSPTRIKPLYKAE